MPSLILVPLTAAILMFLVMRVVAGKTGTRDRDEEGSCQLNDLVGATKYRYTDTCEHCFRIEGRYCVRYRVRKDDIGQHIAGKCEADGSEFH